MQDIQTDFEKTFQNDDMNGDEFDLEAKLSDFKLDKVSDDVKFTVKNLEDLKMVFKKGSTAEEGSEKQGIKIKTKSKIIIVNESHL